MSIAADQNVRLYHKDAWRKQLQIQLEDAKPTVTVRRQRIASLDGAPRARTISRTATRAISIVVGPTVAPGVCTAAKGGDWRSFARGMQTASATCATGSEAAQLANA
jgi:hypothetical protein